jgi:hypothetical protein
VAYTRAQFRSIIRQRLGWSATDTFVADAEMNSYLIDSLSELHSLLTTVYRPGQWGTILAGLSVPAGTTNAQLLFGDFGRLIKVTLFYNQDDIPMQPGDRTVDITRRDSVQWTPWNVRYYLSVAGGTTPTDGGTPSLIFSRPPTVTTDVIVTYIKAAPALANDTDPNWMGWDEYAILDVCIKCRVKEEADVSELEQQKTMLQQRIRAQADPLDMGRAATVQDIRSLEDLRNTDGSWWRRWG